MTRMQSAEKSAKCSPFLFIAPKPCLLITCSYPLLHFMDCKGSYHLMSGTEPGNDNPRV